MNPEEYLIPPNTDYGSVLINPDLLPNYNVTFSNTNGEVGRLDFNGDTMKFIGKADETAQVLFDWLAEAFKLRLLEERKREYDRCVKLVERSRVVQFVWYPKGYSIGANKIGEIYEFQHTRTVQDLNSHPPL
jgi:hypothetical protein